MPLDFPASPTPGQTYAGLDGNIWAWDGTKWVSGTGANSYAPVVSPIFQGNPQAPNPPAGDADTSVATTSFVAATVAPYAGNVGRNLIHNGLFRVAQRGVGPFTAATTFTADRWLAATAGGSRAVQVLGVNDSARAAIGDEAANSCIAYQATGGSAAGDYEAFQQVMEGVYLLAGKTITVSFWAAALAGTPKLGISLTQIFGTGGSPSANVDVAAQTKTLTAGWVRYTATFTVPSAAGKTLGTSGGDGLGLIFWLSSGSANNVRAGSIGVQSWTLYLWGVQLEIGSVATPLEKPDPQQDLAKCQRFYCTNLFRFDAYNVAGQLSCMSGAFPVMMHHAPAVAVTGVVTTNSSATSFTALSSGIYQIYYISTATGPGNFFGTYTASAEI